ncbi:hypothetical protein [Flavobacterium frigoris]|nr:hypothetical protein [Flavobacterium frigoris]
MENKEKQNSNEGSKETNIDSKTNSQESILIDEIEIDAEGNKKIVQRARNLNSSVDPTTTEITSSDNENSSRGVSTEKEVMKTIENEDLNSDITAKRYPASHPDNHKNRGNMELDEE